MQRWGKDLLRHRLDWQMSEEGVVSSHPRHLRKSFCLCQYTEEILLAKLDNKSSKKSGNSRI